MKKILILALAIVAMCSCRTIEGSIATIDKSHVADDMIYDLAETYEVPEIGTVYDYKHKATVVSNNKDNVTYKVKVNHTWYESNRIVYNKYKCGDVMKSTDFKRIKN